jgi:hypothetical protein
VTATTTTTPGERHGATSLEREAASLEREAGAILAEESAREPGLHGRAMRAIHRERLDRVIDLARRALDVADALGDSATVAGARGTLVKAYAARARDACHGAGQLSRSAQRAPTRSDCDDGWRRVEAIVGGAEASAEEANRLAAELDTEDARTSASVAQAAARAARGIVDQRNHAYTFHAAPTFSFGEGWYLAAAATLSDVEIQIEPGQAQTAQAEAFLRDAGLGSRLVPYRSRPAANKHLPEIVARAFRADPVHAQRRIRDAFLGDAPIPQTIRDFANRALSPPATQRLALHWIRYGTHHPMRNTVHGELGELTRRTLAAGLLPVLVGDALRDGRAPPGTVDLTLFWRLPLFQGVDMRRAQLQLFEHLRREHGLAGQLGVTTAGMDGPALMGLPTMYLTDAPNPRLGTWVGAVPGYQEIVRDGTHLERVSETLRRWGSD